MGYDGARYDARFKKMMADCLQLIVSLTLDYTTKVKHMCSLATTTPYQCLGGKCEFLFGFFQVPITYILVIFANLHANHSITQLLPSEH